MSEEKNIYIDISDEGIEAIKDGRPLMWYFSSLNLWVKTVKRSSENKDEHKENNLDSYPYASVIGLFDKDIIVKNSNGEVVK